MKEPSIITVPNEKLSEATSKVTSFVQDSNELKKQIRNMVAILRQEGGIGLAANQLGYDNQVLAIEFKESDQKSSKKSSKKNAEKTEIPLTIFVNPEIVEYGKTIECFEEGCLSVPKIELEVERPTQIKIKYQNEKGKKIKAAPKGLLARILQHEIDHLGGIIFTERVREQFFQKYPELKKLKIAFFGSGEFGAIILEGLILLGLNLDIYTEKSKPAGRSQVTRATPVAEVAKKFGKDYFEVEASQVSSKVNRGGEPHGQGRAERLDPISSQGKSRSVLLTDAGERPFDSLVCVDFGQKIPESILKQAKIAALNIHPSLLPKYIGPTPIQTAILNGDKKTGVSIIQMTDKIDQGPLYSQIETEILENDTTPLLHDRLATLGLKLLIKTLPKIVRGEIETVSQDLSKTIRTRKFTKANGEIDWRKSPKKIDAKIRAFSPWPGSYTRLPAPEAAGNGGQAFVDNKRLIIHKAHIKKDKLVLDIVQSEGKKPMKFSEFLRGFHGPKPEWFRKVLLT